MDLSDLIFNVFVNFLFVFYSYFRRYIGIYLLLFVATLAQYFFTASSSPG